MAELLIKLIDHIHPDPGKNRRGAYKKGMIIISFDDGHVWGRNESKQQWIADGNSAETWHGKTFILKLPNISLSKVSDLALDQDVDDAGAPMPLESDGKPQSYRRRNWQLLVDLLPTPLDIQLASDGEITIPENQIVGQLRAQIKRIRDNAQFTGLD